jgi:hypothetical protein
MKDILMPGKCYCPKPEVVNGKCSCGAPREETKKSKGVKQ